MTQQFNNNLIAIRERNLLEIMDLALVVLRTQGLPLLGALLLGAAPMLVLNDLLFSNLLLDINSQVGDEMPWDFLFWMGVAVAMEMPWAAAPATLYLGQKMFTDQTSKRQIFRDFLRSLPQMFWLQGVARGLCFLFVFVIIPPLLPFIVWPYLNEVILLERNPLLPKKGRMTTIRRARMLHNSSAGDLMARWLGSVAIGGLLLISIWMSLWVLASQLSGGWLDWHLVCRWFLPIALWLVVSFFTVVRFLSYLDLRIRREGWEVELALRAEAAQWSTGPA